MNPRECAAAAHDAISRVGGAFMVDPSVAATAERMGLQFFEFYIGGRAGVLGRVAAAEVCAQLPIIAPDAVTAAWTATLARTDPRAAALAYAQCNQGWGRRRLAAAPDLPRAAALAGAIVDALPVADLPLVAGWRDLPRPADPAPLTAQLLNTLREYRGAVHAHAALDAGLTPVEAIVAGPDGPERARQLGWPEPYPDPAPLAARRRRAEELTDERAAVQFVVLAPAERAEFVRLVDALLGAIRRPPA